MTAKPPPAGPSCAADGEARVATPPPDHAPGPRSLSPPARRSPSLQTPQSPPSNRSPSSRVRQALANQQSGRQRSTFLGVVKRVWQADDYESGSSHRVDDNDGEPTGSSTDKDKDDDARDFFNKGTWEYYLHHAGRHLQTFSAMAHRDPTVLAKRDAVGATPLHKMLLYNTEEHVRLAKWVIRYRGRGVGSGPLGFALIDWHGASTALGNLKIALRGGGGGWRNGVPCRALCFV